MQNSQVKDDVGASTLLEFRKQGDKIMEEGSINSYHIKTKKQNHNQTLLRSLQVIKLLRKIFWENTTICLRTVKFFPRFFPNYRPLSIQDSSLR